jgi:hypothetical protein
MNPKTERALRKACAHWKRLATGKQKRRESIFAKDCALCKLFVIPYKKRTKDCAGCPVRKRTGWPLCKGSPWSRVYNIFNYANTHGAEFREAARAQLEFLQSLLPKKRRKTK